MTTQIVKKLFTVTDYHKMADIGILTIDDRVELINGEIIKMSPVKSKHASIVDILTEELIFQLRKQAIIRTQNPIEIDNLSEPEPDLAIVKFRKDRYKNNHPTAADTELIIEVADSTLRTDRKVKLPLYATAKIPEYWIINIPEKQIEIYRTPLGENYLAKKVVKGGVIASANLAFSIPFEDLF